MECDDKLPPCPRCGGEVDWSTSRDIDIMTASVDCKSCDLSVFATDSHQSDYGNQDIDTIIAKYKRWIKTNPKSYCDEHWD